MNREWNVKEGSITGRGAFRGREGGRLQLLRLGHRDGRALGVIEAVHGVELHDHMQAVGED